jgi:hypothetical protein
MCLQNNFKPMSVNNNTQTASKKFEMYLHNLNYEMKKSIPDKGLILSNLNGMKKVINLLYENAGESETSFVSEDAIVNKDGVDRESVWLEVGLIEQRLYDASNLSE